MWANKGSVTDELFKIAIDDWSQGSFDSCLTLKRMPAVSFNSCFMTHIMLVNFCFLCFFGRVAFEQMLLSALGTWVIKLLHVSVLLTLRAVLLGAQHLWGSGLCLQHGFLFPLFHLLLWVLCSVVSFYISCSVVCTYYLFNNVHSHYAFSFYFLLLLCHMYVKERNHMLWMF